MRVRVRVCVCARVCVCVCVYAYAASSVRVLAVRAMIAQAHLDLGEFAEAREQDSADGYIDAHAKRIGAANNL